MKNWGAILIICLGGVLGGLAVLTVIDHMGKVLGK